MASWYPDASVRPAAPRRLDWSRAEEELLLYRLGSADCTLVGKIRRVSTSQQFDRPQEMLLLVHPEEVLHGRLKQVLDQEGELVLRVAASNADFRLALTEEPFLPGTRYLVFLKRPEPAANGWRWALYRPERRLLEEVRAAYHRLRNRK
jgi:hypothetical protein